MDNGQSVSIQGGRKRDRFLRGATIAVGLLILAFHLAYFTSEATRTERFADAGIPRSNLQFTLGGGPPVFETVDTLDFVSEPYPSPGDTITALNEISVDSLPPNTTLASSAAGDTTKLAYRHDGDPYFSLMVTRPVQLGLLIYVTVIQVLRFAISLGYLIVGLWAVTRGPKTGSVRALSLFCFAMASVMIGAVLMTELAGVEAAFRVPANQIFAVLLTVLVTLVGAFWLNLQILFPHPLGIVRRRALMVHALLYGLTIIVVALTMMGGPRAAGFMSGFIMAQFAAGLAVIGARRKKIGPSLERRQLTLVYFGSGLGLSGLFVLGLMSFIPQLREPLPPVVRMLLAVLIFLLLLLSPVSFAYAFGRYRLLEIEARLRRGTRYVVVTVMVLVVFFLLLYAVSHLLLSVFNIQERGVILAVAIVLAMSFTPAHRRAQTLAESQLYPERVRLRAILQGFLESTAVIPDRETFWAHLGRRLRHGLNVQAVIPVLRNDDQAVFELSDGSPVPVRGAGVLVTALESSVSSLMVDEILESQRILLTDDERAWLMENRIGLLLPMIIGARLIGFLALRFEEESPELHAEDLGLLVTLSSQIALRYENLRLLEENVEKRRMEEQLSMARQVQERFLPRELPETPSLEVAARCAFSLEVAGDYYDVYPLRNERTLLAVGDVSGKGAGAAMLMANVRASLRTISGTDVGLGEAVFRLNQLLFNDTASDQFVTLFVGVFDPALGVVTYVNAGHNAPRIIRRNGAVEQLDAQSIVLGILPTVVFAEQAVRVHSGDLIVAFTDGVSEAMNANNDEFGESRIVEIIKQQSEASVEQAVTAVQRSVETHVGGAEFADDFTLVVARVR